MENRHRNGPAEWSNYHLIQLLLNALNISKPILDKSIRMSTDMIKILVNRAGLVEKYAITSVIHAAQLVMEKHWENHRSLQELEM